MNICNLDIDHFNLLNLIEKTPLRSLKNLPTTWGLRLFRGMNCAANNSSEKPPHHMGIKTKAVEATVVSTTGSEKPPHHMGIKTPHQWLLRFGRISEKPPHHTGIKTL